MNLINGLFYTYLLASLILCEIYIDSDFLVYGLFCMSTLSQVFAAVVLMVSVLKLKKLIKALKVTDFFANERVMLIHLAIQLAYLACFVCICIDGFVLLLSFDEMKEASNFVTFCRAEVTFEFFYCLS